MATTESRERSAPRAGARWSLDLPDENSRNRGENEDSPPDTGRLPAPEEGDEAAEAEPN